MQARRYRPGDVLDDYCPRERRITDHAVVAMVDEDIQRTRCSVCDAEHEYKEAKVPAPRRKTQPPALFSQVLDNLSGGGKPHAPPPAAPAMDETFVESTADETATADATATGREHNSEPMAAPPEDSPVHAPEAAPLETIANPDGNADGDQLPPSEDDREREGGFRRSLIRATFPRPEGQTPPARTTPEFTVQSLHNRRNNSGQGKFRRRRPGGGSGGGSMDHLGPMRFRDHGPGENRPSGGGGRRRRGGKKNR